MFLQQERPTRRKPLLWLRALLVTLLIASGAVVVGAGPASAVGTFANGAIADQAVTRAEGVWGGQCKGFVNTVVTEASSGSSSGTIYLSGYHQGFANAGAIEVTSTNAVRGDVIQVTPAGSTDATAESLHDLYSSSKQLHTAVILSNDGGGDFFVIDSNSNGYPEQVHRHSYNPYTSASGSIIKIWRLGTVTSQPNTPNRDFNGTGNADILWYGPGGAADAIWYGSSSRTTKFVTTYDVTVSGTFTPVTGDFDGDGYGDVLWYGPGTAGDSIWYGTATKGVFSTDSITIGGIYTPVAGDFNGDDYWDVLWYGPGTDADAIWYGNGSRTTVFDKGSDVTVSGTYTTPVAGDFNGNGKWDILWYGAGSADDSLWYGTSTKGTFSTTSITVSGTFVPAAGDFNGNGKTDVLWYGSGSANDAIWYGSGDTDDKFNTSYDVTITGSGYVPVAGDFDDDQISDLVFYGPGSIGDSLWYGTSTKGVFDTTSLTIGGTYTPIAAG